MNKTAAMEWLVIAFHDLRSAQILYEAGHYTDSIGCDLQQAVEKSLKAVMAYGNSRILKSHDLYELYDAVDAIALPDEQIELLYRATDFYKDDRYPNPYYSLPSREEIKEVMDFAEHFFDAVCQVLGIDPSEVKR